MSNRVKTVVALGVSLLVYFFLSVFPLGWIILYPFKLMVTFLHEFGHALGALLTGGGVHEVEINSDGSGVTTTSGGFRPIVIAGGYIGSAVFGNLIMRAGLRYGAWSRWLLNGLLLVVLAIATIWSGNIGNTVIAAAFALGIYLISLRHDEIVAWFLVFVGTVSVLFILQDFRVGPSSDLAQFARAVPILPQTGWMFVWLGVVVALTWRNVKSLMAG